MTTPQMTTPQTTEPTTAPDSAAMGPRADLTSPTSSRSLSQSSSAKPADLRKPPGRRADLTPPRPGRPGELRRIVALFSEHRLRLLFVAVLIVASALISVASPFLLRHILDVSLPARDTAQTALLAGGMVLIAVG